MDATLLNSILGQTPLAAVLFYLLKILWDKLKAQEEKTDRFWVEFQVERKEVQAERKQEVSKLLLALDASTKAIERNTEMYGEVMDKLKD
jgi:hypothetical protein